MIAKLLWNLRKRRRKRPADVIATLRNTRKILLLCVNREDNCGDIHNRLYQLFTSADIDCWYYAEIPERFRGKRERVKLAAAALLKSQQYDLVVDSVGREDINWQSFLLAIEAKIYLGSKDHADGNAYDLVLNTSSHNTISGEGLSRYLSMILLPND
jgi:hypothetical protein